MYLFKWIQRPHPGFKLETTSTFPTTITDVSFFIAIVIT